MISLYEFLVKDKSKIQHYHPKDKNELIEVIKAELDKGNTNLNCIDTSKIKDMRELFDQKYGIKLTNKQQKTLDVSKWDVSNVIYMNDMFKGCTQFKSDLSNWNVSNIQIMDYMFYECKQFNCNLSDWNVSNVQFMNYMFYGCEKFNCDLSNWNVSNVKCMSYIFYGSGLEGKEPAWYEK